MENTLTPESIRDVAADNALLKSASDEADATRWGDVTRRIRQGHPGAFATYYHHFFDAMFAQVNRICRMDEATCLDLVQEAMLKAMRCMKTIDSESALGAWSKTVATSVTYDWLRKQQRRIQVEQATRSLHDAPIVDATTPLDHEAQAIWLEEQIQQLPADLKHLFSLRYRWGWSLKKIAIALGLKTGAVDGRLRRAVEKLREQAKSDFDS